MYPSKLLEKVAYFIGIAGLAIPLLWIGVFKFAPTEAAAIKPHVENHFAMGWLYSFFSDQMVSNIIGSIEILVGIGLVLSIWIRKVGMYAGIGSTVIFLSTISFLFTTPGVWRSVDGVPVTDFFIIKDIALLSLSVWVWGRCSSN
ncbi:DUF417 family protein [Echinicola soli]|uniref:DUF417 family protein n=1 Tax=Echinicola soli TaxID=2591634 RepID=A0A514CKF8_9BACT|nr:DUF417 family protein [Echinicola soli]QDH80270.1 DUF417 family protein [Echinicola soli]